MIPRRAVRAFLEHPRDDLRRYKRMSDAALRREASALPARPPVWKKLLRDQRVCFVVGAKYGHVALWADTGIGKTMVAMALARYHRAAGRARRFLVLVPGKINVAEWVAERDKHCPRTQMVTLRGSSAQKWETVRSAEPLLTVVTYGGLVRMACDKVPEVRRGEETGKLVLEWSRSKVRELSRVFDGLVMDESSADQAVQYRSSLAFKICRQLRKTAHASVAMSATPFGGDPIPLWAQMYLVDGGESLGATLGMFRAAFFSESDNYWGGTEYAFRQKMTGELNRVMAHRSITIEADEATLPEVVEREKLVALPRDAESYCEVAREAILAARGNYRETKNAFLRMRQISSGFLGYTDDDDGARAKFVFDENPKLESLSSLVRAVAPKYKIVIFHEFVHSGDAIEAELSRVDVPTARISASTDVDEERRRFREDPECRACVVSNRMAQGPNLQVARYAAFYETPVDPKTRKQARRRVERQHSEHSRVFLYDFVVGGTYDRRILDSLADGRDLLESILRDRGDVR